MAIKTNPTLIHLDAERMKRRGDKPMDGAETLDEFEYLIDSGVHPLLAAQQLGVKYSNLMKLAGNHGRDGLFTRVDIGLWDRYSFAARSGWGYAA